MNFEFAFKCLNQSIFRSHYDNTLLIWHPYLKTYIQSARKIQNNFIRFLYLQCFAFRTLHLGYEAESNIFNISTLETHIFQII